MPQPPRRQVNSAQLKRQQRDSVPARGTAKRTNKTSLVRRRAFEHGRAFQNSGRFQKPIELGDLLHTHALLAITRSTRMPHNIGRRAFQDFCPSRGRLFQSLAPPPIANSAGVEVVAATSTKTSVQPPLGFQNHIQNINTMQKYCTRFQNHVQNLNIMQQYCTRFQNFIKNIHTMQKYCTRL